MLTRSQFQIPKQDLLTFTLGSKNFFGVLQIDLDSIDYVAKLEIHYVAPCTCIMCLVDT